jgi:hypothetical protein
MRDDQNIREQDCSIEAKSPDALESDLSREFRGQAKLDKISGLFTHGSVFPAFAARQAVVASGAQ